jgi:hypothetical protein
MQVYLFILPSFLAPGSVSAFPIRTRSTTLGLVISFAYPIGEGRGLITGTFSNDFDLTLLRFVEVGWGDSGPCSLN